MVYRLDKGIIKHKVIVQQIKKEKSTERIEIRLTPTEKLWLNNEAKLQKISVSKLLKNFIEEQCIRT